MIRIAFYIMLYVIVYYYYELKRKTCEVIGYKPSQEEASGH